MMELARAPFTVSWNRKFFRPNRLGAGYIFCDIVRYGAPAHPTGSSPYMASGFSHRSPLWPDGFRQLGSRFQAMTSKPPIWQAPSQGAWLSVYRHPDPHTPFPVRITGCSNRNQSLPESYPGFLRFPGKCIMPVPSHMGKAAAADDILQLIVAR